MFSCKPEIKNDWETNFYGEQYDRPRKILHHQNSGELTILGARFRRDINSKKIISNYSILELDNMGRKIREHFSGNEYEEMFDIEKHIDGYILIGSEGVTTSDKKLKIQIVDQNFKTIKDTIFKHLPITTLFNPKIKSVENGNYLISFNSRNKSSKKYKSLSKLIKINNKLEIIWEQEFKNELRQGQERSILFFDFIIDKNGDIVIIGDSYSHYKKNEPGLLVIKTDKNGNKKWKKTMNDSAFRHYPTSIEVYNGEYYITGRKLKKNRELKAPYNYENNFIAKYSESGDLIYNKSIGKKRQESITKIISKKGGYFILIGSGYLTKSPTKSWKQKENIIYIINEEGITVSSLSFGATKITELIDVIKINKNKFISIGNSTFEKGNYLTKWDISSFEIE